MRVGLDSPPQIRLHHPEVLLDQPVDRRRQTVGGEPAEGGYPSTSERGLGVVDAEQPLGSAADASTEAAVTSRR